MSLKRSVVSLGVALSLVAMPAVAQDEKEPKSAGSVTVGGQGGGGIDDSSKLQQYETVPKGAFIDSASYSWRGSSSYFLDLKGAKLGLDDQYGSLVFGKKGSFKLFGSWDQNADWMSNTARTPFTETAPGVFHVPDGMRLALQNLYVPWIPGTAANPIGTGTAPANPTVAGFFGVEPWVNQGQPIYLGYMRRTGKAGLNVKRGEDWNFNLSYAKELRDGNKNTTFYGGSYNLEVATPIAYVTHDFRAEAEYAQGRVFANASANFNKFLNEVPFAEVDNPERLELASPITGRSVINDVTTFRLWLPPENKAYTVDLTGGVKLPNRHKITASLSTGSMKMDTNLLPLSTNPNLQVSATAPDPKFTLAPPYSSVEARYDTFLGALKFTGDPTSKFGYSATYRKFQLKDKTEEYQFLSVVRGDVGASQRVLGGAAETGALTREHEGYDMETLKGEIHVLPVAGLRLSVSYGLDRRDFDRREYEDVKDKNLTVSADYTRNKVALHGAYTNLKRDPGTQAEPPTWQGATQTDIAHRTRNIFSGLITLMPSDRLAITLNGARQTNDFWEAVTGLLGQSFDQLGADLTYSPNAKLSLYGGYVYEKFYFNMAAAYIPRGLSPPYDPANLWQNATTDKADTFRAGFKWAAAPDKLDVTADFNYSKPRSDSSYNFNVPGTPIGGLNEANGIFPANVPPLAGFPAISYSGFPQVSKAFVMGKISLDYHIDKNLTATVMYWKQKFDNVDWQTNNTLPYMGRVDPGANRWFFLGAQVPSYDANIFRAALSYRF